MTKTGTRQKNRIEKNSKYKTQLISIRDWLGFFFTAIGFFLSLSGTFHIDIQVQCNIVIEVYSNSFSEAKTQWESNDLFLVLREPTYNLKKDDSDKQKEYPIEWAYGDSAEYHSNTLKKKKRSIPHKKLCIISRD